MYGFCSCSSWIVYPGLDQSWCSNCGWIATQRVIESLKKDKPAVSRQSDRPVSPVTSQLQLTLGGLE